MRCFFILRSLLQFICRVDVPARNSTYLFFSIKDVEQFRILFGEHVLPHITTSDSARGTRVQVYRAKAVSSLNMVTLAAINVSFSQQGLDLLLPDANISDDAFSQGQFQRAESLGDDKTKWLPQFTGTPIHGLFEVTGYPAFHIQEIVDRIIKKHLCDTAIKIIFEHHAKVRPGKEKGHEHCESIPYRTYLSTYSSHPQSASMMVYLNHSSDSKTTTSSNVKSFLAKLS